jgi:nucleoside-diphosphate-sugar epimerase
VSEAGQQRRVLVVGGAGYIGNFLVRRLLGQGAGVTVLDSLMFGNGVSLAGVLDDPGLHLHVGDVRDQAAVDAALEGVTDVVLLAALVGDPLCSAYPQSARGINLDGSRLLLERMAGRGIDRFVFTSTCSNYGLRQSDAPATEDSDLAPLSLYAETKVEMEKEILGDGGRDFSPTVLRLATAYGQSDRMRFDLTVSEFTRTIGIGEELVVYDADTWRPYCHVADISQAIITALNTPSEQVAGEVFNVGHDDENYTKRMLVEAITEQMESPPRVVFEEGGRDPRNYRVSFQKVAGLGFEPRQRVPESMGRLLQAIKAGAFSDFEARRGFYTNHHPVGLPSEGEGDEG